MVCHFATGPTAGAGYYGNMELSFNVQESDVTVGTTTNRRFTGTHGDGTLTTTSGYEGNAANTDWPGIDATTARGVTGAAGSGPRGTTTSGRYRAKVPLNARYYSYGGRCARTGPSS